MTSIKLYLKPIAAVFGALLFLAACLVSGILVLVSYVFDSLINRGSK